MNSQDLQKNTPLISVVMPVFNAEVYIAAAIESITGQAFTDFELILIDDGSQDGTNPIIRSYMERDQRIVLVENDTNLGIISSLNNGIQLSRGKYIARMDADDISLPSRFTKQVDYLESHPEIDVLGSAMSFIHGESSEILGNQHYPAKPALLKWFMFFGNPFGHPTVMMRKNALQVSGGYRVEFRFAQDYELWSRLITLTNGANLEEPLVYYRIHPQNVSSVFQQEQRSISSGITLGLLNPLIGPEMSNALVELSFNREPETKHGRIKACQAIVELYRKFTRNNSMTFKERMVILNDALNRIYRIASKDKGHPVLFLYWLGIGVVRAVGLLFLRLTGSYTPKKYLDVDAYRKEIHFENM